MNNKRNIAIEAFGWYGAIGLIAAYALSSFGFLSVDGLTYQLINITAALGIFVVSVHKKNYQPATLNVVWIIVGLVALVKIIL
ncbi:MAG: hypothetical protein WC763_00490 [Candidatus Paceibacterota bacterium]|jgi:hypothetical protein